MSKDFTHLRVVFVFCVVKFLQVFFVLFQMMELVATSVNEAERRKIVFEAIKDLEDASDSWEKNGVSSNLSMHLNLVLTFKNIIFNSKYFQPV